MIFYLIFIIDGMFATKDNQMFCSQVETDDNNLMYNDDNPEILDFSIDIQKKVNDLQKDKKDIPKKKIVDIDLIEVQNSIFKLSNSETLCIYSSIDIILDQQENEFTKLLSIIDLSFKNFLSLKQEQSYIYRTYFKASERVVFTKSEMFNIKLYRRKVISLFTILRRVKNVYLLFIRTHLCLNIDRERLYFYKLVIDFVIDILGNLILDIHYIPVDRYYMFYYRIFKFHRKKIFFILFEVPLPEIIFLFTQCLLQENLSSDLQLSSFDYNLRMVIKEIKMFWEEKNMFIVIYDKYTKVLKRILQKKFFA